MLTSSRTFVARSDSIGLSAVLYSRITTVITLFNIDNPERSLEVPRVSDMSILHLQQPLSDLPGLRPTLDILLLGSEAEAPFSALASQDVKSRDHKAPLQLLELFEDLRVQHFHVSRSNKPLEDNEALPGRDVQHSAVGQIEGLNHWTVPNDRVYLRLCGRHTPTDSSQDNFEADFDVIIQNIREVALDQESDILQRAGSL